MWRVVLAIVIAVAIGFLGLQFSNWWFRNSASVLGDLMGLLIAVVCFWLAYRWLADRIDDHRTEKAHQREVEEAYQRGLEDGRRAAVQADLQEMERDNPSGAN